MIAKKSNVHTDDVVARIQEIIAEGKAKPLDRKRPFGQRDDDDSGQAPSKWAAVLDLIDSDAAPDALLTAAKAATGGTKKSKRPRNVRQPKPLPSDPRQDNTSNVEQESAGNSKQEISADEKRAKKIKLKNKKKSKKESKKESVQQDDTVTESSP